MRGNFNMCSSGKPGLCVVIALTEESITNQKLFTFWKQYLLSVDTIAANTRHQRIRIMHLWFLTHPGWKQISFEATATYWLVEQEMHYVQSLSRKSITDRQFCECTCVREGQVHSAVVQYFSGSHQFCFWFMRL